MPKFLFALLLLLAPLPTLAEGDTQVFAASTTGELLIDAQGRVAELSLSRKELGEDVMAAVDARIRAWRFQPPVDHGRPVQLKVRMYLHLLAMREPGKDGLTLAIRNVSFIDPPRAADGTARLSPPKLQRPGYPPLALRAQVGGTAWVAVRVGADGRVTEVATKALELRTAKADGSARQQSFGRGFARAAERAARHWELPDHAGQVVVVPVMFRMPSDTGQRWMRVHDVPVELPAWYLAERAASVQLSEAGEAPSDRALLVSGIH